MRHIVLVVLVGLLTFVARQPKMAELKADASRVLSDERSSFAERTTVAARVKQALEAERDVEAAGDLALLWMQVMRRALEGIPIEIADGTRVEPYATWLGAHEAEVVYNQPGGQWIVKNDIAWRLHDAHRQAAAADAIAWEIVENGLPGECEGYPPCYLAGFEQLHGRYLREHPAGDHAEQAVAEIHESLDQIQRLLAGPDSRDFFNPSTDCPDLVRGAEPLNAALARARVETTATRRALKAIRDKC